MINKKDKIIEISKKFGLSHIGSCLSTLPILEEIYLNRGDRDLVLLDNAHAHLAHLMFTTSEDMQEDILKIYGVHCDIKAYCNASGGSLGHAGGIAIGRAIVDKKRDIHLIVSDGSVTEGSFLEALRIIKTLGLNNIKIYANFNGYTATTAIDINYWEQFIKGFGVPVKFYHTNNELPELEGLKGHYAKL
jgi:transketolase N-terminal domain/subunit